MFAFKFKFNSGPTILGKQNMRQLLMTEPPWKTVMEAKLKAAKAKVWLSHQ